MDVITDEVKLNRTQVKKLTETLEVMSINDVIALALALCPTKFVADHLAIVVDLVGAGNILEFYTYLVRHKAAVIKAAVIKAAVIKVMSGLVGLGEVLFL